MDIIGRLNSVNTLNDYIELTQDLADTIPENVTMAVNKNTVIALNKVRCYEIEYFNKCDGRGAAFVVFERLLKSPPHGTLSLLGADLITLIRYWLEAVRKHLISHHIHWWSFLKYLLEFIKKIYKKEQGLSNILVKDTADCLLDLAISGKTDILQLYEILHTFNLYCHKADKELRLDYGPKFEHFFVRLCTLLATAPHAPTQLAILETLLRWLQPRRERAIRKAAAEKWFQPFLYSRTAVDVFLDRDWSNFQLDSRDFLNCHNATNAFVVSAVCRMLSVGSQVVITGTEMCEQWLDINIGIGISLLLDPKQLAELGLPGAGYIDTLALYKDDVTFIQLGRDTDRVLISLHMTQAPRIVLSGFTPFQLQQNSRQGYDVIIVISSRSDLARVHLALKNTFLDKYKVLLDVNSKLCLSPLRECDRRKERARRNNVEDGSRFLRPDKRRRYGHSGLMVLKRKRQQTFNSPSSASTSSLAQLHDKLINLPLPPSPNSKIKKGVSTSPALSMISESELSQHTQDSNSTLKIFPAQVELKSQSEGDSGYVKRKVKENSVSTRKGAQSDPEGNKDRSSSSHFPITVDSTDSLINQRTESNDKDLNTNNILDLLVQEAFQEKNYEENQQSDSGIHMLCGKRTQDSEIIEGTQQFSNLNAKNKNNQKQNNRKVVSKSTSDESNTEALNECQNFVTVRKKNLRKKSAKTEENENAIFDVKAVEDFFSQHFAENQMGEIVLSPTLAKKINETSSESSNDYLLADMENDCNVDNDTFPDEQIVECLNSIVDEVCTDLEKCAEYLRKYSPETEILNMATNINVKPKVSNILKEINDHDKQSKPPKTTKCKSKEALKIKFSKNKKNTKKTKGKLILEPVSKMSTIIEDNNESDANKTLNTGNKKDSTEVESSFIKRKRKLYSPKDNHNNINSDIPDDPLIIEVNDEKKSVYDNIDDNVLEDTKVTPKRKSMSTSKFAATCYRDLEQDRKNFRNGRSRKLKNKESPSSPKTKQLNEVFEHLKDNIENNGNIIIMDKKSAADAAAYNFTSDSEDEDFKQKMIDVQKRASTTTIGSGVSVMSTRRGRPVAKINYKEGNKSSSNETVTKPVRRKRAPKRKNVKNKAENVRMDSPILLDERMRDAPNEDLNSSFVDKPKNTVKEPVPIIERPLLENIPIEDDTIEQHQEPVIAKDKKKKPNKKYEPRLNIQPLEIVKDGERSISPLPGLIIETDTRKNDREESVTTNLVNKFKKVLHGGPDAQDETNNTQQMLFDNDVENSSQMNITEEFGRMLNPENVLPQPVPQNYRRHNDTSTNVIDDTICSDNETKKSTVGSTKNNRSKRNRLRLKPKESDKLNTKDFRLSSKDTNNKNEVIAINYSQISKPIKSTIEEITIDEVRVTRSKSRSKSLSQLREMETIAISVTSENTIASAGINAHGDMDESPPNTELLNEKMSPREIEDMDNTVKEYYIDLLEKVNVSKYSSKDLAKDQKNKTKSDLSSESISQLPPKLTKTRDSDIAKYLPFVRNTESEASSHTSRKSKSPSVCLNRLSAEDIAKWIPSQSIDECSIRSVTKKTLRSISRKNYNRKSQISPIDIDDFIPKSMNSSNSKPNTSNTEDTDDKHVDFAKSFKFMKPARYSSPAFKQSSDFEELPSKLTSKRKNPAVAAEEREIKKSKLDVIYCNSSQSSTVDDWLKNLSDVSKVPKEDASNEILANVMEKLDTTLAEIHRNTTKDFIGLFVEAQKKLFEMKEERRDAFRRAEERDNMFMSWLRQSATEVLKKDCVRKQAMVAILRDDVDACTRVARD